MVRMVEATGVGAQSTAAMRQHQFEARHAVQAAAEDEMAQGHRRLQRIADHVVEVKVSQALALCESGRMQKDDRAQFFCRRKYGLEPGIGQLRAFHVGRDLDAAHAEFLHATPQLLHRQARRLHGKGPERDHPAAVPGCHFAQCVIHGTSDLVRQFLFCPVAVVAGRRRQHLDVDAGSIHVRQAAFHAGQLLPDAAQHGEIDFARLSAGVAMRRLRHRRLVRLGQCFGGRHDHVAVEVNHQRSVWQGSCGWCLLGGREIPARVELRHVWSV